MKVKSIVLNYTALTMIVGAFSFNAFSQQKKKKSTNVEVISPSVKEVEAPSSDELPPPSVVNDPLPLNKKNEQKSSPTSSSSGSHNLGIGLGQTFLFGGFGDHGEDKITIPDLYYAYNASYSFDMLLNYHYSKHAYENKSVELPGFNIAIKAKVFQFDAFSPFVAAGLGFYRPVWSEGNWTSKGKTTFGTTLAAGSDLKLNDSFTVGIIFHHHNPFDVKQENDHKRVSGTYVKMLITLMYSF